MQSMTYGTLPTRDQFEEAFNREVPRGKYNITLGSGDSKALEHTPIGDDSYNESELWLAIQQVIAHHSDNETAMDFVSGIMGTLGFEWI